MPNIRQQRGVNGRGIRQPPNVRTTPDIQWEASLGPAGKLRINLLNQPSLMQISGVPQVRNVTTNEYATAAVEDDGYLLLTFPAPVQPTDVISYPRIDPAVRWANGAYVTGFTVQSTTNSPFTPNLDGDPYEVTNIGAGQWTFDFFGTRIGAMFIKWDSFTINSDTLDINTVDSAGVIATVTSANPLLTMGVMRYGAAALQSSFPMQKEPTRDPTNIL